ncbi:MAG: cytochrome c [Tabrizicola sp.]|nr:cytochrome c [Tabrizicola sp.]
MKVTKILVAGLVVAAGMAFAEEERTDPNAKEREVLMEMVGKNMGVLGGMASDKAPYDAAAAEAAKAGLIEASAKIEETFTTQGNPDPVSEAKPEIWSSWDDFLKKAGALNAAATAADVSSLDAVKASVGTLGGACKDCHTTYRVQK